MERSHTTDPVDEVGQLLAVIQWCADRGLEPHDVIEARRPEAFTDPTFPATTPVRGRCPDRSP